MMSSSQTYPFTHAYSSSSSNCINGSTYTTTTSNSAAAEHAACAMDSAAPERMITYSVQQRGSMGPSPPAAPAPVVSEAVIYSNGCSNGNSGNNNTSSQSQSQSQSHSASSAQSGSLNYNRSLMTQTVQQHTINHNHQQHNNSQQQQQQYSSTHRMSFRGSLVQSCTSSNNSNHNSHQNDNNHNNTHHQHHNGHAISARQHPSEEEQRQQLHRPQHNTSPCSQQQRVHACDLIERARHIRLQPINTSPIDASKHPSLLSPPHPSKAGKKCLILDVDETLVHSSYENTGRYDAHLEIPLDSTTVNVYVAYRPYLREFIEAIAPRFEVVVFTASMGRYANPLIDKIDPQGLLGNLRLFREHCSLVSTTFVKDLSLLGRDLEQVAIIDNSPVAYLFQQRNAIPIPSWFDDPNDCELMRLIPMLVALDEAPHVYEVLDNYNALLQLQQEMS